MSPETTSTRWTLVTGAGRGLGLEFTRQLLAQGDTVLAGVRTPATAADLHALAENDPNRLIILPLDVADPASLAAAHQSVAAQTERLDLLINNAGVNSKSRGIGPFESHFQLGQLEADNMLKMFRINAVAPLMMAQRFLDLLKASAAPKIVNISSWLGSLSDKMQGGNYSYCASKTALNMLTRTLAFDAVQFGVIAVAVNPGWVQTDMGGAQARLTPSQSVSGILQVVEGLSEADAGQFFDWNGEIHPW